MPNANRLIDIFYQAKSRRAGADRDRYLCEACREEPELDRQVRSLLDAEAGIGDFLNVPVHTTAPASEEVGDVIGRYKLLELLGEGGCGMVYVAEQEEPVRRRVALKVIKLGMDTRAVVARFEAERQALAMMDHPNIAKVLDGGTTTSGRPYFVMELVRGLRITEYCSANKLSTAQRLQLLIQVCQAIQHAHQKGVIHRDIKPSNILVTLHDGAPVPRVIDFGIAKAIEGRLTDATVYTQLYHFIGTPAYMSPEQAEMSGLDVDTRSDIYSLGVLLYELLTGRPPFDEAELLSRGLDAMRQTIREKEPARPSTLLARRPAAEMRNPVPASQVDSDLDWIVMKCLEKDRRRRYETANGLAADLRRHLNNEPVVARPPSTFYRFQKALRRHKVVFATATAVGVSLLFGLVAAYRAQKAAERQVYIQKMNLAGRAWDENNVGKIREILDETADEADRGFEWFWWQRQAHLELKTLRGHLGPVAGVAYSPDGLRIATGSYDRTAKLWDPDRGAELMTLIGHDAAIRCVRFSPDGLRLATASEDRTAIVWDVATGQKVLRLRGHESGVISVAFSADGQRLATCGRDKTARVWNATTGELLRLIEHEAVVWTAVFTADGQKLLTGTGEEQAALWDLESCAVLLKVQAPPSQPAARQLSPFAPPIPFTAAFSTDERWIVTGSHDQTARLWNLVGGGEPFRLRAEAHWLSPRQYDIPFPISFSPDGRKLITGSLSQAATLWSMSSQTSLFNLKGHAAEITGVAFSPDGHRVVTGSYDHTARIWDATANPDTLELSGHKLIVSRAAFSPSGQQVATVSWDKTAKIHDVATGRILHTIHAGTQLWAVAYSRDGQQIATGGQKGHAVVWNARNGERLFPLIGHGGAVITIVYSRDGRLILTAAEDGTARIWDAKTGEPLHVLQPHHDLYTRSADFSPDARWVVTGSEDGDPTTNEQRPAIVWDARTGKKAFELEGHQGGISGIAWSPNGKLIAAGSIGRIVKIWELATHRCLHTLTGHRNQILQVFFSPDSRRVITGSFDDTTRIWDAATGQELLSIKGHIATALSNDGRSLVAVADPPARLLRIATPEEVDGWRREALAGDARMERAAAEQKDHDRATASQE